MPYGLYHEGYGTSVYVGLRYSERYALAVLTAAYYHEVSGFAGLGNFGCLHNEFYNVFGEMCFFDYSIHGCDWFDHAKVHKNTGF